MRRKEKAKRIRTQLGELYPEPLPPLDHDDPFTLLVAVLLSAQCTDERVNQVTPGLFARASTPDAMASLREKDILGHIASCGLAPTKARHIRALSGELVKKHGGQVPADFAALEALPGIGHKSAGVVMAQAFGVPAFPVDSHIQRLAWRWGLTGSRNVAHIEMDLMNVFPRETWNAIHLQMIFFGREHCPARGHDAGRCPICCWAGVAARMRPARG